MATFRAHRLKLLLQNVQGSERNPRRGTPLKCHERVSRTNRHEAHSCHGIERHFGFRLEKGFVVQRRDGALNHDKHDLYNPALAGLLTFLYLLIVLSSLGRFRWP